MTVITLNIADPDGDSSWRIELADDFDTVFGKIYPLQPPASSLEHRADMEHSLVDGRRIAIDPRTIAVIEETERSS